MAVPPQFIEEVLTNTDIVSLVGEYVHLTAKGKDYWGLCPFHLESSPSFHVVPERRIYKCFGCGKGGYATTFLQEIENMHYIEAVGVLAKRLGMEMPEMSAQDRKQQQQREKILKINKQAARFYYDVLKSTEGEKARIYLEQRGLSRDTLIRFGIGFAPDRWDGLLSTFQTMGMEKEALLEAGLVKNNEKGHTYDRFRNRIMFPIFNVGGDVIGFGGRVMDDSKPKYLNSPDTPVYDKSRNLYGLNIAKKSKSGKIILTEGYMDTVALHQAGFDGAVATLGTSLTEKQGQLLSQYFKNVIISYDGDSAGISATQRAIPILEKAGVSVRVLQLRDAKDPDEYIKKSGAGAFANLLEGSQHQMDYRILQLKQKYKVEDMAGKVDFVMEVAAFLATVDSVVEREVYARRVAEDIEVSYQSILDEVEKQRKGLKRRAVQQERSQARRDVIAPQKKGLQKSNYVNIKRGKAEEGLLRVLQLEPTYMAQMLDFTAAEFSEQLLGRWFEGMKYLYLQGSAVELPFLAPYFTLEEMNYFMQVMEHPQDLGYLDKAMEDYINVMTEEAEKEFLQGDAMLQALQERKSQ